MILGFTAPLVFAATAPFTRAKRPATNAPMPAMNPLRVASAGCAIGAGSAFLVRTNTSSSSYKGTTLPSSIPNASAKALWNASSPFKR